MTSTTSSARSSRQRPGARDCDRLASSITPEYATSALALQIATLVRHFGLSVPVAVVIAGHAFGGGWHEGARRRMSGEDRHAI